MQSQVQTDESQDHAICQQTEDVKQGDLFWGEAVGRRLICLVKIWAKGLGGLLGALDLDLFVMEEERE